METWRSIFYTPIFVYNLLILTPGALPCGYYPIWAQAAGPMGFWWARQAFLESLNKPMTVDHWYISVAEI
jgi:hypothetical protein